MASPYLKLIGRPTSTNSLSTPSVTPHAVHDTHSGHASHQFNFAEGTNNDEEVNNKNPSVFDNASYTLTMPPLPPSASTLNPVLPHETKPHSSSVDHSPYPTPRDNTLSPQAVRNLSRSPSTTIMPGTLISRTPSNDIHDNTLSTQSIDSTTLKQLSLLTPELFSTEMTRLLHLMGHNLTSTLAAASTSLSHQAAETAFAVGTTVGMIHTFNIYMNVTYIYIAYSIYMLYK